MVFLLTPTSGMDQSSSPRWTSPTVLSASPRTQWGNRASSYFNKQSQHVKAILHSHPASDGMDWVASCLISHHRNHCRYRKWAPQVLSMHPSISPAPTCLLHACSYPSFFSWCLPHPWSRTYLTTFGLYWRLRGKFCQNGTSLDQFHASSSHDLSWNRLIILA